MTVGLLASAAPAHAQQAELAAKLNEEGKELMYEGKYDASSAKFRDAVARVPEPKYFFNLCTSLFAEGKFSDAMTACGGVGKNSPTAELDGKTQKLMERIQAEAKAQNVPLVMTGGGGGNPDDPGPPPPDPTNPNPGPAPGPQPGPTPQYQQAYGRPPEQQNLFKGTTSDNRYTWTLGFDLFGGGGKIGDNDFYGNAAGGFRIKGDYLLNPALRLGSQLWLSYTQFTQGSDQTQGTYSLAVMDLGVGIYKDLCIGERLCLRPLAGAALSFFSPGSDDSDESDNVTEFNYTAASARLEIDAHFAFGSRLEHVLGVFVGVNAYSPVFSESGFYAADMIELDKGGATAYAGLGYTYRFNTPLGASPFVTLE